MSKSGLARWGQRCCQSSVLFLVDTWRGLVIVSHHTFFLLGLTAAGILLFLASKADLRQQIETHTLGWLQAREQERVQQDTAQRFSTTLAELEEDSSSIPSERATALDPADLSQQQAAVAYWLSRRYHVAPQPVSRLVQEAWRVGKEARLEPSLILAVIAIESRFNPFAESSVGAQGLMQVMTRIHDHKYEAFGGQHAAFDPVTNLRVGVQVLKECIARAGNLEMGLKSYVGAANMLDDGGYAGKVLGEQAYLRQIMAGRSVPINVPQLAFNAASTVNFSSKTLSLIEQNKAAMAKRLLPVVPTMETFKELIPKADPGTPPLSTLAPESSASAIQALAIPPSYVSPTTGGSTQIALGTR